MRGRILFCVALALVPMIPLSFYLAFDERKEEEARARAEELSVVNTVKADLENLFQLVRGLASGVGYEGADSGFCRALPPLRQSFPEIGNLTIYDQRAGENVGHTVCAAIAPAREPFALSLEDAEARASQERAGQMAVGSVRASLRDGRPVIPISCLVRVGADGTRRFVMVALNLDRLGWRLSRTMLAGEATLLVLDRHGKIAARSPESREWTVGLPAPAFERMLPARQDFVNEVAGEDGASRFYAVAHAGGADGLVVVLKTRASDIFRRSRSRLILHLAVVLGVTLLVFGIAWTSSERYLTRPLARLAHVADRLARGNLAERTGIEYEGEIGQLARSFDLMAEFLQQDEVRGAEMLESLRALTARLDSVSEEERTRIAREIHDQLGQQLTAMRFELAQLERNIARRDQGGAPEKVQDLTAMVDAAIGDVRRIATALRPAALDFGGLEDAIRFQAREFEQRTGIVCLVSAPEPIEVTGNAANCLFRICQESLTNVARHAGATAVDIRLVAEAGSVTLTVRDNGRGFKPQAAQTRSLGLLGMKERARGAGGMLSVISAPGEGTTLMAWIPLRGSGDAGDALAALVGPGS